MCHVNGIYDLPLATSAHLVGMREKGQIITYLRDSLSEGQSDKEKYSTRNVFRDYSAITHRMLYLNEHKRLQMLQKVSESFALRKSQDSDSNVMSL